MSVPQFFSATGPSLPVLVLTIPPPPRRAVSQMRRNIVPAIVGSLADAHNAPLPPPDADTDEALRHALARFDGDIDARTGDPPREMQTVGSSSSASSQSTLLALLDSESRVLRVANAGAGRAFLGRRVGSAGPPRVLRIRRV